MPLLWLASDHAGFDLKEQIKNAGVPGWEIHDCGTHSTESCDYPLFAQRACEKVLESPSSLGLLICGTGIGMSIAANKIRGIRAACVSESFSARMAREHNAANILCLGARVVNFAVALECLKAFLSASFDQTNVRHQRRVKLIEAMEK